MIPTKDHTLFFILFKNLNETAEELGYTGVESELVNDMLFNHFLITIVDSNQLESLTATILDARKFNSIKNVIEYI
jgi:hypothetical protein